MKSRSFVAIGVILIACAGCRPSSDTRAAREEILRLDAQWSEAAGKKDIERVLSFWAEDASVLPPGGPAVVGKAAIREFVEKSFQMPDFRISWRTHDVSVSRSGDLAYAIGSNRMSFRGADGKPIVSEGKAVTVWRRDAGGGWKCILDIWNDGPSPSPEPAPGS